MDKLNKTPEEIAQAVRKTKVSEMDTLPLLTSFKGRIGRTQFLKWYVPAWLIPMAISYLNFKVAGLVFLIFLWPLFSLTTKRCHDYGSAGWFGLWQLLPGLGGLMIILAGCGITVGDFHDNKYGKSIYKQD